MAVVYRSSLPLLVVALALGCAPAPADIADAAGTGAADAEDDAGSLQDDGEDAGDVALADAGPTGAGAPDAGAADAGPADAGVSEPDAGPPFSWTDIFDGGLPEELSCLPGALPDLSLAGLFDVLAFSPYQGSKEPGVKCGDTVCASGVPCCLLCGYAACAEPEVPGGEASCPAFTRPIACDGPEDCGGDDDTCCYTLSGAECRPASECGFDLALPSLPSLDGGFSWQVDEDAGPDGGPAEDGGQPLEEDDAGPEPVFGGLLDQGFEVCTSSLPFFGECDLLEGQLCCTSERFVAIDLGLCMSAALCLGSALP